MRENFNEIVKNKTDKELEVISKDHVFYSSEERLFALDELESRKNLSEDLVVEQNKLVDSMKLEEEDLEPRHKISLKDFIPHENYLITPILLYLNVFVFLLMIISGVNFIAPRVESLIGWGGNLRYLTIHGQSWRLLTSIFLHAGIIHLLANMYALLFVGAALEKVIGKNKFLFAYLATGIVASVSSLIFHDNIVSVGASGAIFGLFGVMLALLLLKEFDIENVSKKKLMSSVGFFVFYNIVYGFSKEGIDNSAHLGGLFSGFVIGLMYFLILKGKLKPFLAYVTLSILISVTIIIAFNNVSDNLGEYDETIKEFVSNEQKALWMYNENNIPETEAEIAEYKQRLNDDGVLLWKKNKDLLLGLGNYDYPDKLKEQLNLLIRYSDLRVESCELMIKLIENESEELNQQILTCNSEIENLLAELRQLNNNNR